MCLLDFNMYCPRGTHDWLTPQVQAFVLDRCVHYKWMYV